MNILYSLNKSFSTKVKTIASTLKHIRRSSFKAKHPSSFDIKSQTEKDVVLFKVDNTKLFLAVHIASAFQCGFWTYLGVFFFQSLKSSNLNLKAKTFWGEILEKEQKYSKILSAISILLGWTLFAATTFYSFRSIKKIILHKGGNNITIVTHGLPFCNTFTVPMNHVSSMQHRIKAKKYIPVKLKNSNFYYLIDVRGEFLNPQLYDFTVGVKRGF